MINRRHKDTVFRDLFGSAERKEYALELYNALNGSTHVDPSELEITTLGDAVYMHFKNDVSFLLDDEMVLWEHQSTYNPNMPLRGLQYFAKLFSTYVEKNELNPYGSRQVRLPTPRYVVFYNGKLDRPDRDVMRLSDCFLAGAGDVEVAATVINVNAGHNADIMAACETLAGYARLIGLARSYGKELGAEIGMDTAIKQCIREGVLAEYLSARRAEVIDMFLTEFDEEKTMRLFKEEYLAEGRKEGHEEGRAKGRKEGREETRSVFLRRAADAVRQGTLSLQEASQLFDFDAQEIASAV